MADSQPLFYAAMQRALSAGKAWIGATSPNPPVGAAAWNAQGELLAVAAHKRAGEEHAEAALLRLCRENNRLDALHTVAVTLEPCTHWGKTPPCSDALIKAGVRHVIIGTRDPNPDVKGGGAEQLRAAGIDVIEGIEEESCRRLIHAFAFWTHNKRPFVTVKRAFDPTGSMIPPRGQKTFTSPEALQLAHRLRKKAGAIVTGIGTVLADQPLFTVRHVPEYPDTHRILAILDRHNRTPHAYLDAARTRGLDPVIYTDLDTCFEDLAAKKIQDVLVEAGPTLSTAVLASEHWTMAVDIHQGSVPPLSVTQPLPVTPAKAGVHEAFPRQQKQGLSEPIHKNDTLCLSFQNEASLPFSPKDLTLDDLLPTDTPSQ